MQVKVARIYLTEDSPLLSPIYEYLHQQRVKGATVFRGVKGFGHSGKMREARFLDLHFDLPMVLEFCDEPAVVDQILNHFKDGLASERVLQWLAEMSLG